MSKYLHLKVTFPISFLTRAAREIPSATDEDIKNAVLDIVQIVDERADQILPDEFDYRIHHRFSTKDGDSVVINADAENKARDMAQSIRAHKMLTDGAPSYDDFKTMVWHGLSLSHIERNPV